MKKKKTQQRWTWCKKRILVLSKAGVAVCLTVLLGTAPVTGVAESSQPLHLSGACAGDISKCSDQEREWLLITSLCHRHAERCTYASRLSPFEPNYAIFQYTVDDENAVEVHYSFRYLFSKPHCMPQKIRSDVVLLDAENQFRLKENLPDLHCLMEFAKRSEYFFSYTGQFDFYLISRESGPVINRISNPALHWRKNFDTLNASHVSLEWINFSLEHRSNGQVLSADNRVNDSSSTDNGRLQTQIEYEKGNYKYFDGLSRNSNYVKWESKINIGRVTRESERCVEAPDCITLWVSAKLYYFGLEDNVNWGPTAAENPSLRDYDIVRVVFNDRYLTRHTGFPEFVWGLEWTLGSRLLETDSVNLHLTLPSVSMAGYKVPWFIQAHFGPMNNLSDYTKSQNSVGVGVRFD